MLKIICNESHTINIEKITLFIPGYVKLIYKVSYK